MTRYLDRLLAGEMPSVSEWNEHLVEFHRAYNDMSFSSATLLHTLKDETSYAMMARSLHELMPAARVILEVGCGDGTLLSEIEARFAGKSRLIAIDLSEAEIERARTIVPSAELVVGDAASVQFTEASLDAIVSHLSFRVLANLRVALPRFRRALRDSGVMLFLIEYPWRSPSMSHFVATAIGAVRERFPAFSMAGPAIESMPDERALQELLAESGFSGRLQCDDVVVRASLRSSQLVAFIERLYLFGLLEQPLRDRVSRAVCGAAEVYSSNGLVEFEMPLQLVKIWAT